MSSIKGLKNYTDIKNIGLDLSSNAIKIIYGLDIFCDLQGLNLGYDKETINECIVYLE